MGLKRWPHLLKPLAALVGEVGLAQLLKQLPLSRVSSAIGPTEIDEVLCITYPREGTNGLEPAASELGSSVAADGAPDAEDHQPMTNHHDCHSLG